MYPTSSTTTSGMKPSRRSSASRLPVRLASPSLATHSVAVAKATRWPARQARIETAIARCVLPVPGGPSRTTFSRACRKSSWPRCSITCFLTERWKVKSNSSSVLRAGKRAALIRDSPPWLSREATSVESTASRKRSWDHSSSRARSASFGAARPAAGAFSERNSGRARRPWSCRDQLVVAVKRPQLDLGLSPTPLALAPQLIERPLMVGLGKGQAAGEDAGMAGGELAGVERHCPKLALGDADLDPAADQTRVERVVVAIEAQVGLGRDAGDEAALCLGQLRRQGPHLPALGLEAL